MANPFDKFDAAPAAAKDAPNPFDKFDAGEEASNELGKRLRAAGGGIEAAGSMLSGIPGMVVGGLHGLGSYVTPGSGAFGDIDKAVGRMEAMKKAIGSYEPQSEYGKLAQEGMADLGNYAKDKVGAAGEAVAGPTGRYVAESLGGMGAALAPIPGGKFVGALGRGIRREFGREPSRTTKADNVVETPVAPKAPNPFDQFDAQGELPLQFTEQQYAESRARDKTPGQGDLFQTEGMDTIPRGNPPPLNPTTANHPPDALLAEQARYRQAQAEIEARQRAMEMDVGRQTGLDMGAADRARQEAAPVPGLEDAQGRALDQSQQRTRPYMDESNQGLIDDTDRGYVANQYGGGQDGLRIDENGMPIRADRSMEAANLENPLQRNLWGDELPRQAEQEAARGITSAIDRMPPGEARTQGIGMLKGQHGAIDLKAVTEGFRDLLKGHIDPLEYTRRFYGAFDERSMRNALEDVGDPKARSTIVLMSPDEFHQMAAKRDSNFMASEGSNVKRDSIRDGLVRSKEGLTNIPQLWVKDSPAGLKVWGHEGRHRMDVFKELGVEKVPVIIRHDTMRWGETPPESIPARMIGETSPRVPTRNMATPTPVSAGERIPVGEATEIHVPHGQRGAIDLGPQQTPDNPRVAGLTKDSPEVVAAKGQLADTEKRNVANKILGNRYVDNITTPEQVLASAEGAKDIGKVAEIRNKTVSSGMNSAALSSNNPLLKYVRYVTREAEKFASSMSEKYITGEEGLQSKWQKLDKNDRNDVMALLMKQDKEQVYYSDDALAHAGFSDKQVEVIHHVREMEKVKLDYWNKQLEAAGMDPVQERVGHFPGVFKGDYRALVMDPKGNVVGFVGAPTWFQKRGYMKKVQELYPDHTFVQIPRRNLAGMSEGAYTTAMSELAKVMAKNDPEFAALQSKVNELVAHNADKLYGANLHAMDKKGIFGNEGNKPWRNETENTNEAMHAYKNYWDEGMRSHSMLPVEVDIKGLDQNPTLEMPNAKSYVNKYIMHMTGRSTSSIAHAFDSILDLGPRMLGIGPSKVRTLVGETNKRVGQILMGYGNLPHTAVQFAQVPSMSVPQFANIAHQFNIPADTALGATMKGVATTGKFIRERITGEKLDLDPYTRAAMEYAEKNGMRHFSEFQDIAKTEQSKAGRVFDSVADLNREIPEKSTRPYTYFTLTEMMRDVPNLTTEQKLTAAINATNEAMIDYSPREKPMVYGDMGQTGKLAGSLKTFAHGAWAQYGRLLKEAGKGNVTPLATMATVMFALAGVRGIYGYDDADSIVKYTTGLMGNRRSIREVLLDPANLSEVVKSGVLSASTGLDLAGRLNVGGFIPEDPIGALIGAHGEKIKNVGVAAYHAGKEALGKGNGPIDFKNLALELAPNGMVQKNLREGLMNNPKTDRLMGKDALPGNTRNAEDIRANRLGFTSLKQANLTNYQYNDSRRAIAKQEDRKELLGRAEKLLAQDLLAKDGKPTLQGRELMNKFFEREGTVEEWVNHMASAREAMRLNVDKQQRLQGIPSQDSLESIYKYKNYQRSRDYKNAN